MNSDKIKWCIQQKKGLQLIDKKPHLSESYIKEADETLENMFVTKGKWKLITGYYACYNALYSILMKCGIKCEIHDCTIETVKILEKNNCLEKGISKKLEYDKQLRIDNQYYLKNREVKIDYEELLRLFLYIKNKIKKLTIKEINETRKMLEMNNA